MASIAASAWLESSKGERTPVRGSCLLGRSASCGLPLRDPKVSREHALVHSQNQGEFWLIDLGSANGTYLNGRRVAQPTRLSDGDRITVADFTFTFHGLVSSALLPAEPALTEATIHDVRTLNCWLLVADIEGSTQLLQKVPAAEAPQVTGNWFSACTRIIEEHRGTINKFLGDGFLAYWTEDANAASVAAALLALRRLQDEPGPRFRVVVHFGCVSAGGAASLGEESLIGNEVNFVFRMEKLSGSLGVFRMLSEPAQTRIKSLLPTTAEGRHPLSGFDGTFSLFSF